MPLSDRRAPDASLAEFEVGVDRLLGHGGEASVYALDDARVLRVLHGNSDLQSLHRRQCLLDELRSGTISFALPEILEIGERDGRWFTVERRLRGTNLMDRLHTARGNERTRLIESHLEAAATLRRLHLDERGWYGELLADDPVRSDTWRAFLVKRAASSLRRSDPELRSIDSDSLADAMPEADAAAFVHLDAFAGNMLVSDTHVTAVLDFGTTSIVGDGRLNAVAAGVYLSAPQITPMATRQDRQIAQSWLHAAQLDEMFEPVRRWLAAYWSFALDDAALHDWCRATLLPR